ncbi:OmpA family protein [Enterovibrio makurazakiensis]|uniref:OmpA family protein n=1 Tax=Enterovibrio makurazakiensis TaxID=2910232 RepID=UPI003D1FDC07
MKIVLMTLLLFLLAGCSGNNVDSFPEAYVQPNDLKDLDLDGVINERDKCPETIKGAIVDNDGCSGAKHINQRITLNVRFQSGSSYINPADLPEIENLANFLKNHPYTNVTVEGHASTHGDARTNKWLSLKRAKKVSSVLSSTYGVERHRIRAVGYGEERLLDTTNTPDAHQRNRRVVADIRVSNKETPLKWTIYTQLDD